MVKLKEFGFISILRSNYCKIVLLISILIVSFIIPKKIFYGYYTILGVLFVLTTSLLITCFIRNIKEKVKSAKAHGASLGGIIGILFGFGALHACTIGAPICGASIGGGIIALIFPSFAFNLFEKHSIFIILISLIIQLIALYFIGCFKRNHCQSCRK